MDNLSQLLSGSRSTRKYFVTLPVWLQMELHNHHEYITTAEKLHRVAGILEDQAILR